eukprot:5170673-Amphidinium_carterae.1
MGCAGAPGTPEAEFEEQSCSSSSTLGRLGRGSPEYGVVCNEAADEVQRSSLDCAMSEAI